MPRALESSTPGTAAARRPLRRILVVDDDRPSREGLSAALAREGHLVDTAADAWQAMLRLRAQRFDVAVVDLDLPSVHGVDLGGWDVVRIAGGYQPGIAVIVLSADEDPMLGAETLTPNVAGILGKPIGLGELTRLVNASRTPVPPSDSRLTTSP
jgi:two-component system copper resistance phosphate regulon response regulator CusR